MLINGAKFEPAGQANIGIILKKRLTLSILDLWLKLNVLTIISASVFKHEK